eukprot:403374145
MQEQIHILDKQQEEKDYLSLRLSENEAKKHVLFQEVLDNYGQIQQNESISLDTFLSNELKVKEKILEEQRQEYLKLVRLRDKQYRELASLPKLPDVIEEYFKAIYPLIYHYDSKVSKYISYPEDFFDYWSKDELRRLFIKELNDPHTALLFKLPKLLLDKRIISDREFTKIFPHISQLFIQPDIELKEKSEVGYAMYLCLKQKNDEYQLNNLSEIVKKVSVQTLQIYNDQGKLQNINTYFDV